ncbi:methyltransferase domain-containing protein [Rubrobacter tropicus]|uniref:Methyltransferase domain-containing protein n=1 Tax=Rubrobacter tropicus TaxID=2653851 RepID=A0A6G8QAS5_9ACTN|nr:class I SAM-dependent methyltransferase [Rubrobacter tropicus]QIN83576.1 methyltransferase domain-containing protein [Rubrobacter tropicus]
MERPRPDLVKTKERQRSAWASGDYSEFGAVLQIMSELLCEAVDLRPGQKVLDVATGSGNTALASARRFGETTGIDYVPALLERGRERAAAERLKVAFREGDAEDLPYPDASFDVVLSTVGVMFAPDQERAAGELLRICRPGGRIGLSNWTPDGFAGELGSLFGSYLPFSPGLKPPVLWGTSERLRELLGGGVRDLRIVRRSFVFRYRSVRHYLEVLQTQLGPTREALLALDPAERGNLTDDVVGLVGRFNRSGDGAMVVPSDYLEVVATRL